MIKDESELESIETDQDWLDIADKAFEDSDSYLDSGLRTRWERNYALARSEHPSGSKYLSEAYAHRSKVFRGKTHAAIRRNLAACAVALFSTRDVVSITPENDSKPEQLVASKALDLLLNYHLDTNIPWYRTANGAYREALTNGIVFSKQYWLYEQEVDKDKEIVTIADQPAIELIPPENVRISPAADWLNPIDSSPYVIILYPMFMSAIKERMELDWNKADDAEIIAANNTDYDSVRSAREGNKKSDSKNETVSINEHDVIWVRENFIRKDGQTVCYYTIGSKILLTDPRPVSEVYPHCKDGRPPLRMGVSDIEPFSVYPQGMVERVEGSQIQANEIANQRFDNVKQVLNKRWIVQRNKNVDYRSLVRNIPGSTTLSDDVNAVKPIATNDVTASSYQEQNMINMDFDELSGTFSTASVATNRQLNETVGGMQLLSGNSNVLTEYSLRTFVESWVEPVLRDCVELVKVYEDDEKIEQVTGQKITHFNLQAAVNVRVNVGFGATDPSQKVNKLMFAMMTVRNVLADPNMKQLGINGEELASEIFGSVGYKDAARFVPGIKKEGDPQIQQMQQQIQELQQQIETDSYKLKMQMQIDQMKMQGELEREQMRIMDNRDERRVRERIAEMNLQEKAAELALREQIDVKKILATLSKAQMDNEAKGQIQQQKQADDLKAKLYTMKLQPEKATGYWPG